MNLENIIRDSRWLLQDFLSPTRYSVDEMVGFVNQALQRISVLRPDLFSFVGEIPCIPNEIFQMAPYKSIRLMNIYRIKDGSAVIESNREVLDQALPTWMSEAPGPAVNFMRDIRNPNGFLIYPRAPKSQILIGEYAESPMAYELSDEVSLLPEAYMPVVVDATVFLAASVDDEAVNSNRAQLFKDSFTNALGINARSREITDTETGGLRAEDVV